MVRHLAVILAADVVEYSRLMSEDEAGTLDALTRFRTELLDPIVKKHDGEIIKRMGDGWFVEFGNTSDAVAGSIELQSALIGHDTIRLRVGVHIGDVTMQEDDLFGGAVNIAARLQALAQPGQVLISETMHSSLDAVTADLFGGGEAVDLKNISRPVHVWRWPTDEPTNPEVANKSATAQPTEKPSIAVLPFTNLSTNPEHEFFADGIVEDLIMALSRFAWLFVIARNSCFTYKGKTVQSAQVADDLGVRYIVQGSVRQSSERIRVTAQLVDAEHDRLVWSETYNRPSGDIFDIQDELSQAIAGVMVPAISGAERDRCLRSSRPSLDAWEAYQKGLAFYYRPYSRDDNFAARRLFDQSVELDPEFSDALAMIAMMGVYAVNSGQSSYSGSNAEILEEARSAAERAIAADDNNAVAHVALGRVHDMMGHPDLAVAECSVGVSLNPNLATAHHEFGLVLSNAGRSEEAIHHLDTAIKLSPNDPTRWNFHLFKAIALMRRQEYEAAILCLQEAARLRTAAFWPHVFLASCYHSVGQTDRARSAIDDVLARNPEWTIARTTRAVANLPPKMLVGLLENLRLAGLPEK